MSQPMLKSPFISSEDISNQIRTISEAEVLLEYEVFNSLLEFNIHLTIFIEVNLNAPIFLY